MEITAYCYILLNGIKAWFHDNALGKTRYPLGFHKLIDDPSSWDGDKYLEAK
jgi:hypothetical protein